MLCSELRRDVAFENFYMRSIVCINTSELYGQL